MDNSLEIASVYGRIKEIELIITRLDSRMEPTAKECDAIRSRLIEALNLMALSKEEEELLAKLKTAGGQAWQ